MLARFDHDERFIVEFPDLRREALPRLVRHVDLLGGEGVVLYAQLTAESADAEIAAQIAYFTSLGQAFEWKVYGHDRPQDLVQRLARHGFAVGEREAVMVLDVREAAVPELAPGTTRIRQITRAADLGGVAAVKQAVYAGDASDRLARLAYELTEAPDYLSVYLAEVDGQPAACAWIRFPAASAFASLWGGSTLPDYRQRGLYTALLWARVAEARQRGYGYVTVDAGAMSRPILARNGFFELTSATGCAFSPH